MSHPPSRDHEEMQSSGPFPRFVSGLLFALVLGAVVLVLSATITEMSILFLTALTGYLLGKIPCRTKDTPAGRTIAILYYWVGGLILLGLLGLVFSLRMDAGLARPGINAGAGYLLFVSGWGVALTTFPATSQRFGTETLNDLLKTVTAYTIVVAFLVIAFNLVSGAAQFGTRGGVLPIGFLYHGSPLLITGIFLFSVSACLGSVALFVRVVPLLPLVPITRAKRVEKVQSHVVVAGVIGAILTAGCSFVIVLTRSLIGQTFLDMIPALIFAAVSPRHFFVIWMLSVVSGLVVFLILGWRRLSRSGRTGRLSVSLVSLALVFPVATLFGVMGLDTLTMAYFVEPVDDMVAPDAELAQLIAYPGVGGQAVFLIAISAASSGLAISSTVYDSTRGSIQKAGVVILLLAMTGTVAVTVSAGTGPVAVLITGSALVLIWYLGFYTVALVDDVQPHNESGEALKRSIRHLLGLNTVTAGLLLFCGLVLTIPLVFVSHGTYGDQLQGGVIASAALVGFILVALLFISLLNE